MINLQILIMVLHVKRLFPCIFSSLDFRKQQNENRRYYKLIMKLKVKFRKAMRSKVIIQQLGSLRFITNCLFSDLHFAHNICKNWVTEDAS